MIVLVMVEVGFFKVEVFVYAVTLVVVNVLL